MSSANRFLEPIFGQTYLRNANRFEEPKLQLLVHFDPVDFFFREIISMARRFPPIAAIFGKDIESTNHYKPKS
jgi:hypothetical protein